MKPLAVDRPEASSKLLVLQLDVHKMCDRSLTGMPYYALQWDELPQLSSEALLTRRGVEVKVVDNVVTESATTHGIFFEAEPTRRSTGNQHYAAYTNLRPSELYPKIRIGILCSIRQTSRTRIDLFSIRCHAFADCTQLGGETVVENYEEARRLVLAFIDYASDWITPRGFGTDWSARGRLVGNPSSKAEDPIVSSPLDSPELRGAQDLLHQWSTQISEKLTNALATEEQPLKGTRPPLEIQEAEARTELTAQETASVWKRLCRESKGLCYLRPNHVCSFSESELILREQTSARELRIWVSESALRKKNRDTIELIRIFKAGRGSIVFEGRKKISSVPQLALALIQELAIGN
jgi:hypothetical protein